MNDKQHRPTISDDPRVGAARHNVYKGVIDYYHKAMEADFYIEAIALMESLIADRLESLLNEVTNSDNFSFKTVGYLANKALNNATIAQNNTLVDILEKIKVWAKKRNKAIHEMSKLSENDIDNPFSKRYAALKEIAEEAYRYFRKLDNEISSLRK